MFTKNLIMNDLSYILTSLSMGWKQLQLEPDHRTIPRILFEEAIECKRVAKYCIRITHLLSADLACSLSSSYSTR